MSLEIKCSKTGKCKQECITPIQNVTEHLLYNFKKFSILPNMMVQIILQYEMDKAGALECSSNAPHMQKRISLETLLILKIDCVKYSPCILHS